MEEDRMYRIDRQLSDINEKFSKLIRLEERHLALSEKVEGIGDKIHKHANFIMELQHSVALSSKSVGQFEKLAYMVIGSCLAAVAYFFVGGSV